MKRIVFVLCIVLIFGCAKHVSTDINTDSDFEKLALWMSGAFSSYKQSMEDTSYYNIDLVMYPIWHDRTDGYWFYVEQSLHGSPKPYRQRVYHLSFLRNGLYESNVYDIKNAGNFIGCWNNDSLLSLLTMDSLEIKKGCSIVIRRKCQLIFEGSTVGSACKTSLHNADHARSEVVITKKMLKSWDRGFDKHGNAVWGPENGPYEFDKTEEFNIYE